MTQKDYHYYSERKRPLAINRTPRASYLIAAVMEKEPCELLGLCAIRWIPPNELFYYQITRKIVKFICKTHEHKLGCFNLCSSLFVFIRSSFRFIAFNKLQSVDNHICPFAHLEMHTLTEPAKSQSFTACQHYRSLFYFYINFTVSKIKYTNNAQRKRATNR